MGRASWLLRHAIRFEVAVYVSIWRWITRHPSQPGVGAKGFSYVGSVTFAIWVFIVLSAVEIPIAHLLIPWEGVRIAVLVLGLWGLTWMLGYYAGLRMYPHVVHEQGVVARNGPLIRVELPWEFVADIRSRTRNYEADRGRQVIEDEHSAVLAMVQSSQTNIDLVLGEPVVVLGPWGRPCEVSQVRVWADDPRALVLAVRAMQERS